eukprot:4848252-Pleurochrysis_carterae.AAC.1
MSTCSWVVLATMGLSGPGGSEAKEVAGWGGEGLGGCALARSGACAAATSCTDLAGRNRAHMYVHRGDVVAVAALPCS